MSGQVRTGRVLRVLGGLGHRLTAVGHSLRRGVRRHGPLGAVRLLAGRCVAIRDRRGADRVDRCFDAEFGVETSGRERLEGLRFDSVSKEFGNRYQGINPRLFGELLAEVPVRHEEFAFVDYGSGKGRALLLAAQYPFRRVVGVEFAPPLHEVAVANIDASRSSTRRCGLVESVCVDAAEFEPPDGPLVLFFYNPFELTVWKRVLDGLRRSLDAAPRETYLIVIGGVAVAEAIHSAGFRPVPTGADVYARTGTVPAGQRWLFTGSA